METSLSIKDRLRRTLLFATAAGVAWTAWKLLRRKERYDLYQKVVVITGGSRGLGLVLARELAWRGAHVVICARDADQLSRAAIELKTMGATIMALQIDVSDQEQVRQMLRAVVDQFGTIDVLITNAGIIQVGPTGSMDAGDYHEAMDSNFWGMLYPMLEAVPYFKAQGEGRIVNITSIGGKISVPHLLPYSASKFAAVGLSEGMHTALKKYNIHVTTVVPDLMRTGSPRQINVKGNHEAEYAWFKIAASLPFMSQKAETAAQSIVDALQEGAARIVLTTKAKVAIKLKELAPDFFQVFLSVVERLLPAQPPGVAGMTTKKGFEAETTLSQRAARQSDLAAATNNEF